MKLLEKLYRYFINTLHSALVLVIDNRNDPHNKMVHKEAPNEVCVFCFEAASSASRNEKTSIHADA